MISGYCTQITRHLPAPVPSLGSTHQSTVSSLLEKLAPLKKVWVIRQRVPWLNSDLKRVFRNGRLAERKWLRTKFNQDLHALKDEGNQANRVMNEARCEFYTDLIAENSEDQRKFSALLSRYCVSHPRYHCE